MFNLFRKKKQSSKKEVRQDNSHTSKQKKNKFPEIERFKKLELDLTDLSFEKLYQTYFGSSFEKTAYLNDVLSNTPNANTGFAFNNIIQHGTVNINNNTYKVQILGTFSLVSNSWKWIWDYPENSGYRPETMKYAIELKEYGKKHHLDFFTDPMFTIGSDKLDLYLLMICLGILNSPTGIGLRYETPQGNGVLVIAFERGQEIKEFEEFRVSNNCLRTQSMLMDILSNNHLDSDHLYPAILNYFIGKGYEIALEDNSICGMHDGSIIKVLFDEKNELVQGIDSSFSNDMEDFGSIIKKMKL